MDLNTYERLIGAEISTTNQPRIVASIERTRSMLETLLGFTLTPSNVNTNLYNELGISPNDCACPNVVAQDDAVLNDPDDVEVAYRLYPYDPNDRYFHVDPFNDVYKVKLVYVKSDSSGAGVTIKTYDVDQVRVDIGRDGIGKYVQLCEDCLCRCDCGDCVQLAVDANWLWDENDSIPNDLLYLWSDMVTFYSDRKNYIKSESITTHSYTKFDRVTPEMEPYNLGVLRRYSGPYGTASQYPTITAKGRSAYPWV